MLTLILKHMILLEAFMTQKVSITQLLKRKHSEDDNTDERDTRQSTIKHQV